MRKWLLTLILGGWSASAVEAQAAGVIRVPMEVFITIMAVIIGVTAVLWGFIGVVHLLRWFRSKKAAR
jgi:hypothetical protein